jgi:aminoglycoside phosphotransferase (APT) family kinase protein
MTDLAGIEVERVAAWMHAEVGTESPLAFQRLPGGHSNLTYRVTDASGRDVVLRRPPLGHLLPTAHDMSREYRIITGLGPTPVPVADSFAFCGDVDITGAPFYVMAYVDGHVLHSADVAGSVYDERQRRRAGESFIDVLADLHDVNPADVGLADLGRHEGYVARQLKRWYGQWQQSKTRELPMVDEVHDFLAARIPEQGPARVVHGDYRLGNCLTDRETGEVRAVLDWEIATLGDPLADLGYVLATWSERSDPHPAVGAPSMTAGFPTRAELVERYGARSGRDLSQIDFYVSFSHWKGACISEGVYARYLEGALSTAGVDVEAFVPQVNRMAKLAYEVAENLK